MIKCDKCKINISGEREYCPLCGKKLSDLNGKEDFAVFPVIPFQKDYQLFMRIVIFLSLSLIIVVELIDQVYVTNIDNIDVAAFICFGIVCSDIVLYIAYKKRKNIRKAVMYEAVIGIVLMLLWDWYLGWHGWSINYAFPIVVAAMNLLYFVLSLVDRAHQTDYGIYFFITIIGTIMLCVLLFCGIITNVKLSATIAGIGTILLLAEIVFCGQSFKAELSRRLYL